MTFIAGSFVRKPQTTAPPRPACYTWVWSVKYVCMCVYVEVWPPSFCTLGHWASGTLVNSHVDAVGSHLSVESPSASRDLGWQRKWCPDLHGQDSWLVLHRSGQVHTPHLPVVCSSSLL